MPDVYVPLRREIAASEEVRAPARQSWVVTNAAIIDGVANKPIEGHSIWIDGERIKAIGRRNEIGIPAEAVVIDASGKHVIPGFMNADVHLLMDIRLENLARHADRYEDLIVEAAQVALRNGVTTVFDTWGPRRFLQAVRDRINAGRTPGARIFCAGNLIGFDGPFSDDFLGKVPEVASTALVDQVNGIWVENTGRDLMWLPPEQVAHEVRGYIGKGVDFIKYASTDHASGAFLAFSPQVQTAIVREALESGITAQAHTMSLEGLRIAIEAGCSIVATSRGPIPIPDGMLELIAQRRTGVVVRPFTQRRLDRVMKSASERQRTMLRVYDRNIRNLIGSDASLLLGTDGGLFASEVLTDPQWGSFFQQQQDDSLSDLGTGHFAWFKAMEEKGCAPMDMLKAATCNVAAAYGKDRDLGTLEPGKIADLLVLDRNPLESAENYRTISMVVKQGEAVDRDTLPETPILTKTREYFVQKMAR